MLTKERLDAFLSSSDVQLDIDVPGYNGEPVAATLLKRRIGRLASLLYCTFCGAEPSDMGECTYTYKAQEFYQLMVFSPQHEDVFVLGAGMPQIVGPHLGPFVNELRDWYAGYDRRTEAARTAAGRKMMAMYVAELHKKYSDAAAITEVRPDLVQSLESFCTRYDNDGSRAVQELEQFSGALLNGIPVPDLIYPSYTMTAISEVYATWGRPFSAFDAYYSYKDEDSYIAALYEEVKKSYDESGFVFLRPGKDPLMACWAAFVTAWSTWHAHSLFDKYREVRKALEGSKAKKVVVTYFETPNHIRPTEETLPLRYFTDGLWEAQPKGDGGFSLLFWLPSNCPKIDLSLLKSISYRGKVLYEDPAL